jgi:hypothetical protein
MRETEKHFSDETLEFWRRRTSRTLSHEDAREIAHNLSGFIRVLFEWQLATRETREALEVAAEGTRAKGATRLEGLTK